jgi:Tfp pilus assembly protein PilE
MDIQSILERIDEQLFEDESLRSNLDDAQAQMVFKRAQKLLERRLQNTAASSEQEVAQILSAVRAVNQQMRAGQTSLADVLDNMLPLVEPGTVKNVPAAQKMPLIKRLVTRLRSIWRRSTAQDKE